MMKRLLFLTVLMLSLASCSMMHDDRDDCPSGLYVQFVYDYNIQRADMFKDHVGGVTVFVFDDKGYFVEKQSVANTSSSAPLREYGYKMNFTDLKPGKYQLIALANQKSYDETLAGRGAKYRWSNIQKGDSMSALSVVLDYDAADASGVRHVDNKGVSLDTLWHGMKVTDVEVKAEEPTYTTVSLTRDTKNLNIALRQLNTKDSCDINDYDIYITDRNGKLLYDNAVTDGDEITYTPYQKWNTYFTSNGSSTDLLPPDSVPVVEEIAHADLSFNRLMYRNYGNNPAMLYIYNNKHNVMVAKINIADCLSQGRNAWEYYNYSPQEYLDREYNYKLEFILDGDRWNYIYLTVSVLPWAKRIQNESI